jgi:hypothetical protein
VLKKTQAQNVADKAPYSTGVVQITLPTVKVYEKRKHEHRHDEPQCPHQELVQKKSKTDAKHSLLSEGILMTVPESRLHRPSTTFKGSQFSPPYGSDVVETVIGMPYKHQSTTDPATCQISFTENVYEKAGSSYEKDDGDGHDD